MNPDTGTIDSTRFLNPPLTYNSALVSLSQANNWYVVAGNLSQRGQSDSKCRLLITDPGQQPDLCLTRDPFDLDVYIALDPSPLTVKVFLKRLFEYFFTYYESTLKQLQITQ